MKHKTAGEIQAILRLDAPLRFNHFVKRVVDTEKAWGLWNNGWVLMENNDGTRVFPLWPAYEYADLCRAGEWSVCEVREIPLSHILDQLIPRLAESDLLVGIFPTEKGQGIVITPHELADYLNSELQRYE